MKQATRIEILLVEDSQEKRERIEAALRRSSVGAEVVITTASDGATARRFLRLQKFDVMILDVVLPAFPDGELRNEAGLDLLRELEHDESAGNPGYIVGITGHVDRFEELRREFEAHAWLLLRSTPSSDAWLEQLVRLCEHVKKSRVHERSIHSIDVAVTAALYDPELLATLQIPWSWEPSEQLDELTMIRRGQFTVGKRQVSVVTSWSSRMGLVGSALLCSKLIQHMRPRVLVMPGICAGTSSEMGYGDIVFASEAWSWESGKIVSKPTPGTVLPDPHFVPASGEGLTIAQELVADGTWLASVRESWKDERPTTDLRFHVGPMASGSAVVADSGTVQKILSLSRKTVAIDMEAYAVYAATRACGKPTPEVFCIKSVSDFADRRKGDKWRSYAAHTSAAAMRRVLEQWAQRTA